MTEERLWKWVEEFELEIKREILLKIQRHLKFSDRVDINSIARAIQ